MERSQVLDNMSRLKLYGMKAAYDEIISTAVKRQHDPQQIIGNLLTAEIREKQARSVKYQMTIARLPFAKELEEFDFEGTDINETLVHDLARGDFLDHQRNVVLVGGTGTGKTHTAVAIARACIQAGRRGTRRATGMHCRSDFPARLSDPQRAGIPAVRASRWPASVPPDQQALRAYVNHRDDESGVRRMANSLRRRQNDHRSSRPPHSPLRNPGDRQRELALQEPRLKPTSARDRARADSSGPRARSAPTLQNRGVNIRSRSGVNTNFQPYLVWKPKLK